jgi:hypothetical protein
VLLALAGVVPFAFAAPGDANYVPPECAVMHMDVWVDFVQGMGRTDDGNADDDKYTYECVVGGTTYLGKIEHVNQAVMGMGVYADRKLNCTKNTGGLAYNCEVNNDSQQPYGSSTMKWYLMEINGTYINSTGMCSRLGRPRPGDGTGPYYVQTAGQCAGNLEAAITQYEIHITPVLKLKDALTLAGSFVPFSKFKSNLEAAFYGGLLSESYPDDWQPDTGTPTDPGGGGGGVACRDGSSPDPTTGLCADGSVPTEDRPSDSETNCWVLDIPCNFRKLFIPQRSLVDRTNDVWEVAMKKPPMGYIDMFGNASMDPENTVSNPIFGGQAFSGGLDYTNNFSGQCQQRLATVLGGLREGVENAVGPNYQAQPYQFDIVCDGAAGTFIFDYLRPAFGIVIILAAVFTVISWFRS